MGDLLRDKQGIVHEIKLVVEEPTLLIVGVKNPGQKKWVKMSEMGDEYTLMKAVEE